MKNSRMNFSHPCLAGLIAAASACATLPAQAVEARVTHSEQILQQECGSCHVVYPPQFLSAASWRAVVGGLDKHFGTDASLDASTASEVLRYLQADAGRHNTSVGGKPLLRITETRWFVREHGDELPPNVWRSPAVKSAANCSACHTGAAHEDYSENTLRIPRGAGK